MKKLIFTLFCLSVILTSNAQLSIFSDSPDNAKYLSSWGQGVITLVGTNLPVINTAHSGTNALVLDYKNNWWQVQVFKTMDLTTGTSIDLWIYSDVALAAMTLPKFGLMQNGDKVSALVPLGNIVGTLTAATWKKVSIPMSSFTGVTLSDLKSVYFNVNDYTASGSAKLIVDDIVANGVTSGVSNISTKKISATYSNSILSITDYNGEAYIYSVTGKSVAKLDVVNGKANVKLQKGVYLVQTGIGTGKLLIK